MADTRTTGTNGGKAYGLSRIWGTSPASQITTYYLVLFTGTAPTDDTIANECTDANYSRVAIALSGLTTTGNVLTNTADINWPLGLTANRTIVSVGLATLSSGGYLHHVNVTTGGSVTVNSGTAPKIPAGSLSITVG